MPGPVSAAFDPEFGTSANAAEVREAVESVLGLVSSAIGDPKLLADPWRGENNEYHISQKKLIFSIRELRILRFALNRALESL